MSLKKKKQLGMAFGTANARLKKKILFDLVVNAGLNKCFRCDGIIETEGVLSIEHKVPWLDSEKPKELFFDLGNISFSHLSCNSKHRRISPKIHGTESRYKNGCRCFDCKSAHTKRIAKYRKARKKRTGSDRKKEIKWI